MKYVVLSDTHLGQNGVDESGQYSLLSWPWNSDHYERAASRKQALAEMVTDFAKDDQVTLIGCGDILDLSLSTPEQTYGDLRNLLTRLSIGSIIHVIGNHDHHLWMTHCEATAFQHSMFPDMIRREVYTDTAITGELLRGPLALPDISTRLAYPEFHLTAPETKYIFTHGHLFGGLYTLLHRILSPYIPDHVNEHTAKATVNILTLETIYWLLGQTGCGMGVNGLIEALYADIQKGKKSQAIELLDRIVDELLPDGLIKGIPDSWERGLVKWVGKRLLKRLSKSKELTTSVDRHAEQTETVKKAVEWFNTSAPQPSVFHRPKTVLVSGHTHRGFVEHVSDHLSVVNLGSWLVEPKHQHPDTYAMFIDGDKWHWRKVE